MLRINYIFKRFSHQHTKHIFDLQYVNRFVLPSCSDCIYFVPSETYNQNNSKCRKFINRNFITGQIETSFADINRQYHHLWI